VILPSSVSNLLGDFLRLPPNSCPVFFPNVLVDFDGRPSNVQSIIAIAFAARDPIAILGINVVTIPFIT
jgi:hypothetical protein